MGRIISFLIYITFFMPQLVQAKPVANGDLFSGKSGQTKFVWPSIPFIMGGDLQAFREEYGRSRSVLKWEAIGQAIALMDAGAYGAEALEIILAFDQQITRNRWRSQKRVPVSFEGFFNSKLDSLYSSLNPKVRHLAFRHVSSPIEIIGNASANVRPGRISEIDLQKIDFIIYGSYSTSDRRRASWNLFLYVVNVKTGVTRVIEGHGDTQAAAEMAAEKLFRLFQKTTFPSTIRYGGGRSLELLASDVVKSVETAALSSSYRLAKWACEDLDGRLPSEREMAAIERAGDFDGGVTLDAQFRDHYYWALRHDYIYALTMRKAFPKNQVNGHAYLRYVCVK